MFEFLGYALPDFIDQGHDVVVLDNLVMRSTSPWERVRVAKSWVDQLSHYLTSGSCDAHRRISITNQIAQLIIDLLINDIPVKPLSSCRHRRCLTNQRANSLQSRNNQWLRMQLFE